MKLKSFVPTSVSYKLLVTVKRSVAGKLQNSVKALNY